MHYGIVGAGMLGLALALRLANAGHKVTVVEAAPEAGGLASPFRLGDIHWDRYYHVIAGADRALRGLLAELGLEDSIAWKTTRTNFYDGNSLRPLDNALDYWRLPGLRLTDKLRLAATILYAARITNGLPLEHQGAREWLTRLSGRRTWDALWHPLLRAKLGENVEHASAAYIWSVIRRFYGAREGRLKTERFGYVPGGYRRIVGALAARLDELDVALICDQPVVAVTRDARGLSISAAAQTIGCDRLIMTCAAPLAAALCPALTAGEAAALRGLRYQGIICASLLLKRPLGGAYLTYITDARIAFTAVIEMSTLVERSDLGGHHLIYLPRYLPADDPLFMRTDDELAAEFRTGLTRMFPDLTESDVLALRISRARHVMAVPTRNYSAVLPPMETSVPGLYIVNSAQIVNAALSVNDTVRLANNAAARLTRSEAA